MKNFTTIFGIITLAVIIGFSTAACDNGSGGGGDGRITLPQNKGENEVLGKTLYLSDSQKIDFAAAGTTFKEYDEDELNAEGSYSYNSEDKTITFAIEYIYWDGARMNKTQAKTAAGKEFDATFAWIRANFDTVVLWAAAENLPEWDEDEFWDDYYASGEPDEDAFLKQWVAQKGYNSATLVSQWKSANPSMNTADKFINAILAEEGYKNLAEMKADYISWVDEVFVQTTYDYQFTADDSLLVQEKLPANKGSNELSGKTFYYYGYEEYTFTATGYTRKDVWGSSETEAETGTYAYSSAAKRVWLRPEKIYNYYSSSFQTMSAYYTSTAYGNSADEKAGDTNSAFRVNRESYGLTPDNWIGDGYYSYSRYSVRLNRSIANTPEIKIPKQKLFRQLMQDRQPSTKK
jgi:hypothetical protein